MRCAVSTFDPTVAAFILGDRIELGGQMTLIGARQPWFKGMSEEIMDRRQYIIPLYITAGGLLRLFSASGPVPVKSKLADPSVGSMVILSASGVPSSM